MDIEKLSSLPEKIENKRDYPKGRGFLVTVKTTYTRIRRVRALNAEDAKTYALSREARFAPKYHKGQSHAGYDVEDIEVVSVEEAPIDEE